jgi:hypothetical protein
VKRVSRLLTKDITSQVSEPKETMTFQLCLFQYL